MFTTFLIGQKGTEGRFFDRMKTEIIKINRDDFTEEELDFAAQCLREGKLVAFPTETVYGLGGNAFDATASARIYAAKGRPSDNPLIVHIADRSALTELAAEVPESAYRLAEAFWPGPLTMILKKSAKVPKTTTGGLDTVAIRMPADEIAAALIRRSGIYVAAPSANASGRPSTTKAEHVIEDLDGKIDVIIDGGASAIGLESTIVDLTGEVPLILRPGYINAEQLAEVLGEVRFDEAVLKKSATENIARIVDELNHNANTVVNAVGVSLKATNSQNEMIGATADAFQELSSNMNVLINNVQEIGNRINGLSTANNQIVDSITQLSALSEEVSASAEETNHLTGLNVNYAKQTWESINKINESSSLLKNN